MTILLIGTVSASDNNTSDFLTSDNESLKQLSEEINIIQSSNESQDNASFDDLQKDIDEAQDSLILNRDYTYSNNDKCSVLINKTITIEGNNHIINASGLSKILNIAADNVTVKNIVFIYDTYENFNISNAFNWTGLNGEVYNCTVLFNRYSENLGTFIELADEINHADGVLILNKDYKYFKNIKPLSKPITAVINSDYPTVDIAMFDIDAEGIEITKSIIIDGQGHTLDGDTLSRIFKVTNGTVIFKNIIFYKGSSVNGSAIYGKSLAINCTFDSNYCRHPNAREVSSRYGLIILVCEDSYGGATYDVNAVNCTFKNNGYNERGYFGDIAGNTYGGAMYGCSALNCTFISNNKSPIRHVNVTNCTFIDNNISGYSFNIPDSNSPLKSQDKLFIYLNDGSAFLNGINVTIKVYKNNILVSNYYCLSGDAWIVDLEDGDYTAILSVEDSTYMVNTVSINITSPVTIEKIDSKFSVTPVIAAYKDNKYLIVTLKDNSNNPIIGATVSVNIHGVKHLITDSKGQVKLSTKDLTPKIYSVKIKFAGNAKYNQSTISAKVIIKKAIPKLTASKKSYEAKSKNKNYDVVLKDNKNKALIKTKLTLKIKGKLYKTTTNSKGKATFKITRLTKKGNYKATITFAGNNCYNKVSKTININIL